MRIVEYPEFMTQKVVNEKEIRLAFYNINVPFVQIFNDIKEIDKDILF